MPPETKATDRTTISVSKNAAALLHMAAEVKSLGVGEAAEKAIEQFAGDPRKLAEKHTAKLLQKTTA